MQTVTEHDVKQTAVRTPAPDWGIPSEVMPGVYSLRMPMPFRLDHINLYLLDDPNGWTIVDCGLNTAETMACWEGLFATVMNGKPVARIIVTHLHPDHIGLAHWLNEKTQAPIYMTQPEWQMAQDVFHLPTADPGRLQAHYQRLGLENERLQATVRQAAGYCKLVKVLPENVRYLHDGDVFFYRQSHMARTPWARALTRVCLPVGNLGAGDDRRRPRTSEHQPEH